jgi:hypothetical protein
MKPGDELEDENDQCNEIFWIAYSDFFNPNSG